MKIKAYLFFISSLFITGCQSKSDTSPKGVSLSPEEFPTLTIAVAANAQYAIQELKPIFEQQTGRTLEVVASSSGKLTAQILQGAPYDIFLSADVKYPRSLYEQDQAIHPPRIYATGKLILWTSKDGPIDGPEMLLSLQGKVAIPNPETAPYGRAVREVLQKGGLWESLQGRLVFGESVSQVNQYLATGAAEAGFTARSAIQGTPLGERGTFWNVPADLHSPVEQGAIITWYGFHFNPEGSAKFMQFLFSGEARSIFEKYGYLLSVPDSKE